MSSTNGNTQECNNIDRYDQQLDQQDSHQRTTHDKRQASAEGRVLLEDEDKAQYDIGFLNMINESGWVDSSYKLVLRVGACIILIRNLSVKNKHCNGTHPVHILDLLLLSPNLIKAKK